jgi:hypothetical protein
LGKNNAEKFLIAESSFKVLSHWKVAFSTDRKSAMNDLNENLKDKQYFATNIFTLADIILYAVLYNVPFGPSDRLEFSNVIRYFDLIQHLVYEIAPIPGLIKLTSFDLDVPFVAVVPEKKAKIEKKDGKKIETKSENPTEKLDKKVDKKVSTTATEGIIYTRT